MTEQISTTSKIYANSLLDIGLSSDVIMDNLTVIKEVSDIPDFKALIINPTIDGNKKAEIIDEIFKNKIDDKMISFIKLVVQKERFNEINGIINAYKNTIDNINNVMRVEIVSAIELTENYRAKIVEKLENKYQKSVIPTWLVDSEIIGGLVIKNEDDIFDNSIKSKIEKISKI